MAITPTSTLVPAGFPDLPEVQAAEASSVASTATVARIRRMGGAPGDTQGVWRPTRRAHGTAIFTATTTQSEWAKLLSVRKVS